MASKSEISVLDVLLRNEPKSADMVDIIRAVVLYAQVMGIKGGSVHRYTAILLLFMLGSNRCDAGCVLGSNRGNTHVVLVWSRASHRDSLYTIRLKVRCCRLRYSGWQRLPSVMRSFWRYKCQSNSAAQSEAFLIWDRYNLIIHHKSNFFLHIASELTSRSVYFMHYTLLVVVMHLLLSDVITEAMLHKAEQYLHHFWDVCYSIL